MRQVYVFLGVFLAVISISSVAWAVNVGGLSDAINVLSDVRFEFTRGTLTVACITMAVAYFQIQRANPAGWAMVWSLVFGVLVVLYWPKFVDWAARQAGHTGM